MIEEFNGVYEIEFVGDPSPRIVMIEHPVTDAHGHVLYLVGPDQTIYPWSSIIKLEKKERF